MSRLVRPPAAIDYPRSDGKPSAESDAQLHAILYAVGVLGLHYAERADVYVSGDSSSTARREIRGCRSPPMRSWCSRSRISRHFCGTVAAADEMTRRHDVDTLERWRDENLVGTVVGAIVGARRESAE